MPLGHLQMLAAHTMNAKNLWGKRVATKETRKNVVQKATSSLQGKIFPRLARQGNNFLAKMVVRGPRREHVFTFLGLVIHLRTQNATFYAPDGACFIASA